MDSILAKGSYAGFECSEGSPEDTPNGVINPGIGIAVPHQHPFFKTLLDFYNHHHFVRWNGRNSGNTTHKVTRFIDYDHKKVLEDGIVSISGPFIYPIEYLCPLNYYTGGGNEYHRKRTYHSPLYGIVGEKGKLPPGPNRTYEFYSCKNSMYVQTL